MPKAFPQDLRERVVVATDDGVNCRAVAARFGVGVATPVHWRRMSREHGRAIEGKAGSDLHTPMADIRAYQIIAMPVGNGDITLLEFHSGLAEQGTHIGIRALWRFFDRRGIARKKVQHAIEQDRPDILRQRQTWFDGQLDLDPERLYCIDETSK